MPKLSETLRSLGFTKNGEKSSNPQLVMRFPISAGNFYYTPDNKTTRAKDEEGYIWAKPGVVNLTPQGFIFEE